MKNSDRGSWKALIKKAVAAASLRNSLLFVGACWLAPCAAAEEVVTSKSEPAQEQLRLTLFKDATNQSACLSVKAGPRGRTELSQSLNAFLNELLSALKKQDVIALQPLFHPRLNISLNALKETFAKFNSTYTSPLDTSLYRLWALNTVDGAPKGLNCPDDHLVVYPHYGYALQFAAWVQITGQKEIGRIYASIVPVDNRWYVGAFHSQQWTHDGKDPHMWIEAATNDSRLGYKEAAYIKYDLAAKLLDGGSFLELALAEDVVKARDALLTTPAFEAAMRQHLQGNDVAYIASIFVEGGAGFLVRVRVPAELSLEDMKGRCKKIAQNFAQFPWAAELAGVKCAFLMPGEKPQQDGAMGGLFVALKDKS